MATNFVKYGSTSKNVLIKSNNFNVGSDDIDDYGPTSSTGFYSAVDPPINGYVIYVDKATQGPSIHVAQDDTACIFFLKSFGSTGSTINDVLLWAQNQSNILVVGKTQPSINPSGLVAYYDVGTISSYPKGGSTLYDLSGNGYNVTLYNTPTFITTGKTSLSFSKNSFEYGSTSTNLPDLNNFTIESKFRVTSSLTSQVTSVVTGQYNLSTKLNFSLGTNNAPINYNMTIGFFNGSWRSVTGFTPTLNTWYHVTGTYDGSSLKMYIDGALSQTLTYTGTPQSGGVLRIARRWDDVDNNATNFFPGDIEFIRIYNRSLSSTEVNNNYLNSL
jgi:hypothetical protein